MARKGKLSDMEHWHSKRLISMGLLIIVAGLVYNMFPQRWDYVFMVSGALVLLKGIALKFLKK